jgi:nondiscriminating aspartyl-tRNA synthetase
MTFLVVRDRHGLTQILDEKSEESQKLKNLHIGTVLTVEGLVFEEPRAAAGVELHEPKITVDVPVEYVPPIEIDKPISHKSENFDTLFDNRVIGLRNINEQAVFKIQAGVKQAVREYLMSQDFTEFNSPKLLPGATEGGAEVFKLDYFGKEATLAQSGQFYKQIMAGVFERAFEINPTYRAELSYTTRHMTEFMHIDVEMAFIESYKDVLEIGGGLLNYVVEKVWERYEKELKLWKAEKPKIVSKIPEVSVKKLHELYFAATKDDTREEKDPTPAEEKWICEYSAKTWDSDAVFITEFPISNMKFYHVVHPDDATVTERADLIFRGVEIATLTRREHRYDKLIAQLKTIGADPEHPGFKYYLQAFKYGMPPHGGFGMGLERLTQKLIGLQNVKEASLFPRDVNRLAP